MCKKNIINKFSTVFLSNETLHFFRFKITLFKKIYLYCMLKMIKINIC